MLNQLEQPTKSLATAILASFPPEERHPGRWCNLDEIVAVVARQRYLMNVDVKNAFIWLQQGQDPQLEWRSFNGLFYARPTQGALPCVMAHQLPYLKRVWDLLTDEWVAVTSDKFACAAGTRGGWSYLGELCNKHIIEEGYEKRPSDSLDTSRQFLRRGKSRIVIYPKAWPVNGQHLTLPALTASP